jgi:hypothetical protein
MTRRYRNWLGAALVLTLVHGAANAGENAKVGMGGLGDGSKPVGGLTSGSRRPVRMRGFDRPRKEAEEDASEIASSDSAGQTTGSNRAVKMGTFGKSSPSKQSEAHALSEEIAADTLRERQASDLELRAGQLAQGGRTMLSAANRLDADAARAKEAAGAKRARAAELEGHYDRIQPKGRMRRFFRWVANLFQPKLKARVEQTRIELLGRREALEQEATVLEDRAVTLNANAAGERQMGKVLEGEATSERQKAVALRIRPATKVRAAEVAAKEKEGLATRAEVLEARVAAADPGREAPLAQLNQHLLNLGRSPAQRAAYRAAAQRYQMTAHVESKPGEVSQDAISVAPEKGVFAIGDGLTNSAYPGPFARALVRRFTAETPAPGQLDSWIEGATKEWSESVRPRVRAGKMLPVGASTFVGVQMLKSDGKRQMRMVAIGDSVAFVLRDGKLRGSFPLNQSADMTGKTPAITTDRTRNPKVHDVNIDVAAGDEVFLTTDALAKWAMKSVEEGEQPFDALRGLASKQQMKEFVRGARKSDTREMAIDDTSLVRFVIPAE